MADHPGAEFGLSKETLENIVQTALDDAGSQGATQAEASVAVGTGLSVTVRQREVETLEYQRDRNFTVTVYLGHRKGSASTSDLSDTAVAESVRKACSIASYTAEDEYAGLADAELMATDPPDLDLDRPWSLTPEAAIELATECEA
ncbi:MAG: DNA gyrase modulator, partial [Gammaproteobacteria bacterium]